MHPIRTEFDWPKLRRQLEEILAIVKGDHSGAAFVQSEEQETELSVRENDATVGPPDAAQADEYPASQTACVTTSRNEYQTVEPDNLYNDALVVLTEFGQASPAMLQMWLSIDYSRAITILNRFEAEGLVSSKGRVRHKAYSLRRSDA
jgi:DNA segregation ATPase FtsK/SpoIIIE-like protein